MGLLDYFKRIESWSAEKVRTFLEANPPKEYNLVDVRQPGEYKEGHLPGARLIPVKELEERLTELDPQKQTITYCAAGVRSRAAASILTHAGFAKVASMAGGIRAWQGLVADGEPEMNTVWFSAARSPEQYIGLSWLLEEGTCQFYAELEKNAVGEESKRFFHQLVAAEEEHKSSLRTLYQDITGGAWGRDFPASVLSEMPAGTIVEGGVPLRQALEGVRGKSLARTLQLAIALEANSYDRYLLMRREAADERSRAIFNLLAEEERTHLLLLSERLDRALDELGCNRS